MKHYQFVILVYSEKKEWNGTEINKMIEGAAVELGN